MLCRNCNHENNEKYNYCEKCGTKLKDNQLIQVEKNVNKEIINKNVSKTLLATLLVLLFTCILSIIWMIVFKISMKYFFYRHNTDEIKTLGIIFIPILSILLTKSIFEKKKKDNTSFRAIICILIFISIKPLFNFIYYIVTKIVTIFKPKINWAENLIITGPISFIILILIIIKIIKSIDKHDSKQEKNNNIKEPDLPKLKNNNK